MHGISLRGRSAVRLGRLAAFLSRRLLHRSGSVIGGAVLLRLAPSAIAQAAAGRRITLVTGTNGKSTTTAMIAAALRTRGLVASNTEGANTAAGLAWATVTAAADELVLEVDEAWLPWAVRRLAPQTVVLLNLTRDQLHRKPEIRPVAQAWRTALRGIPLVVANADDPYVCWAAGTAARVVFVAAGGWTADGALCPACGALLRRSAEHWSCTCGLSRPAPTVRVEGAHLVEDGRPIGAYRQLPGDANLGNAASAIAAVRDRVPAAEALRALSDGVEEVAGRYAELSFEGRQIRLLLAKNPAGWDAVLGMLRDDASILLAFTADGVDGRDTSWLYDVPFERLRHRRIAVTGSRATDLAVRLHLAGVGAAPPVPVLVDAVRALPPGPLDLVATYSAFQAARKELGHG